MSLSALNASSASATRPTLRLLQREISVGVPAALSMLAASLAAGVLVCSALGPGYLVFGAAAGVTGALFGGLAACLVAPNSMILWGPLVTISLVQASFVADLDLDPRFTSHPAVIITALTACTLLAGVLQIVFSLGGFAKIVKFTPHTVLAGFINGVSASIFVTQIKMFLPSHWEQVTAGTFVIHPTAFIFVLALVGFNFWFASKSKKIPPQLMSLIVGFAAYHALSHLAPNLDLGPTLGRLPISFPPLAPVENLILPETRHLLFIATPDIIMFALATVVVGTFQSLLAFRMAENMLGAPIPSQRGLVALGVGDIVSAATGGLAITVAAPMTAAAFRNGGRSRLVGATACLTLLLLVLLLPELLGAIPRAVVVALLIIVAIAAFDRWSARLFWDLLRGAAADEGRRVYYDLAVVLVVMIVTLTVSIVPGILAGFAAACITFAVNMSRPVVRRRLSGVNARSKRVRTASEFALLRQSGERWVVLQLTGVLFFGNCETLSREVESAFDTMDVVVLDCRGVSDIDASGANIMRDLLDKTRKLGKHLLFCNVPDAHRKAMSRIVGNHTSAFILSDLDSALEWIETKALTEHADTQVNPEPLDLEGHDFVRGLNDEQRAVLTSLLTRREFSQGAILAVEGEPGDRMWLIMKGCVNIYLRVDEPHGTRRIASLATGTTVGEMALVENASRSASIIAAEDIVCWELDRGSYDMLMREHPQIGTSLLTNLIREMAHRIRNTSEQLRETQG
jgi:SulP family sulfate permease